MSTPSKLQRAMNPDNCQSVTIILNPRQVEIVNRLYQTGLWGGTPKKVVENVLCDGLKPHATKEAE